MPKVSIIMPILNSVEYIKECMDSVLNQTLVDIEIIPVDAGSTDGTVEILEEYTRKDNRVMLLHSDTKSMGYQYNIGISAAKGEYIGFVESDDYVVEDMFEVLYEEAKQENLDWVRANYYFFMDYPKVGRQLLPVQIVAAKTWKGVFNPKENPHLNLLGGGMIWSGIYRRDFLIKEEIKLNETLGASFQDVGFCWQVYIHAEKAKYINRNLYCYRRDNMGSSVYSDREMIFEWNELNFILDRLKKYPQNSKMYKRAIYAKAIGKFFNCYRNIIDLEKCSDEVKRVVVGYRDYLISEMDEDDFYLQHNVLHLNERLTWLKQGIEVFDENFKKQNLINRKGLETAVENVLKRKRIVIFGCGDNGLGICSLLLRLQKNEILGFCDNDTEKWNKDFLGIKCFSPNEIPIEDDVTYLVANRTYYWEICMQLQTMGIECERILLAPPIFEISGTSVLLENEIIPR